MTRLERPNPIMKIKRSSLRSRVREIKQHHLRNEKGRTVTVHPRNGKLARTGRNPHRNGISSSLEISLIHHLQFSFQPYNPTSPRLQLKSVYRQRKEPQPHKV